MADQRRLEKEVEVLSYLVDRLVLLTEDNLTPYQRWVIDNHLSNDDELFITNLTGFYILHLYPDQSNVEIVKAKKGFKEVLGLESYELTYEDYKQKLKEYQKSTETLCTWDPDSLVHVLHQSGRFDGLKELFLIK
ncbi:hypothetical protein YDYSY3_39040 [Paenibacillus chitinolyticus]|uniref:hypothetical protein n=1 Tax=Paenibacillus chitinolyticus TaxID=79263 RepID=UPI0026E49BD7|nr:hypothetical protein [Paenibacillus chitinolyticus]GKS12904.1 hypothetical protein YDYSY3_39040 [Paenibacillus chitinolyticus]